jgi:autotransporter-associated beta strand protein
MSANDHDWFHEHATAYAMGGLSAEERTRIESHAAACGECAAHLSAIQEMDASMNHLFASIRPTAGFEQAIIDRLDRPLRLAANLNPRTNPLVRRAAIAAAAAIVLSGFGYVASEKINNGQFPTFAFGSGSGQTLANSNVVDEAGQRIASSGSDGAVLNVTTGSNARSMVQQLSKKIESYPQDFKSYPRNAQKWGFGGGTNTAQNWMNLNSGNANRSAALQNSPGDGNDSIRLPTGQAGERELKSRKDDPGSANTAFTLNGGNTYTGGTTVTGGVLQLNDANSVTALAVQPSSAVYFRPSGSDTGVTVDENGQNKNTLGIHHGIPVGIPLGERATRDRAQLAYTDQLAAAPRGLRDFNTGAPSDSKVRALVAHESATTDDSAANAPAADLPAQSTTPPTVAVPEQPVAPQPLQRKVIRNGTMDFTVDSFDSAYLQVSTIVSEEGGYIGTTNSQQMPNGKVTGSITIRVSPDHLDVLVLKLRALGELKGQKITADDVTREYTDLGSELRAAKAMEERLLDLIKDGKGSIKDLLGAEKELGDWREKIEKITGQMNYFDNLAAMSTLELTLTEKDIKTPALASQTETVDMGVETEDVEKARADAIAAIDEVKGRIVESELKQFDAGQLAGKIVADVPPDKAGPLIDHLKQLGKVSRLEVQRQEVTTDGHGNAVNADTLPPGLRVEQKDTRLTLSLYNLANVAPRQTANVELACDDVEFSYHAILDQVTKLNGRVISSNLSRPTPDQVTGTLSFEVKSTDADGLLMDVKQTGEVVQSNVTENPDTDNVTSTKRGFSVQLRSLASVNPREVRTLAIATPDVTVAYGKLLATVQNLKARVILSKLDNETDSNGNQQNETAGWIDFEVKRSDVDTVERALSDAGDSIQRQVVRSNDDQNTLDTKLQFKVGLHNAALLPPRENWTLAVECGDVDSAQADVLSAANSAGGRVVDSTLSKEADGKTTAHIIVDVPLDSSAILVDRVKHEGDLRIVQSTKNPQAPDGKLARSRLEISIVSPESIVTADHGIWGTIRAGLTTSATALLWSLQLIVVGLCVVGPFVAVIWMGWRVMVKRKKAPTT